MGRKPKPTTLKLLAGNPGRRPLNAHEPRPQSLLEVPAPPDWLRDAGRLEWERLAPEMVRLRLLTVADLQQFAAYCHAYGEMVECEQIIAEEGRIIEGKSGSVTHPAVRQRNAAMILMRQIGSDFGLSPSARTGIEIKPSGATGVAQRGRA